MLYNWSGKTIECKDITVQLTSVLSERDVDSLGQCVIVALGKTKGISELVVVKMRVEYDIINLQSYGLINVLNSPRLSSEIATDVDDHDREVALRNYAEEWLALGDMADSGHTPRCLTPRHDLIDGEVEQDQFMPYPGGYIHALVMTKVPGRNVQEILLDLTEEERSTIREQLTDVLE
jgi:hypothetical protein